MPSRIYHLKDHEPVAVRQVEPIEIGEPGPWPVKWVTPEEAKALYPANNVRGNRNGADASQPWPVQPPGDSRHLEGGA